MTESLTNPLGEPPPAVQQDDAAMQKILARWAELELVLERSGKADLLVTELQGYVTDLKNDVRTTRLWRNTMMVATAAYVVFVNSLLVCLIFYHQIFFLALGQYGKAVLILAVFSTSFILIAKILAGLFRTHGDRNKDEMLPPHLKAVVEAYGAING